MWAADPDTPSVPLPSSKASGSSPPRPLGKDGSVSTLVYNSGIRD